MPLIEYNKEKWQRPFYTIWVGQAFSLIGSQVAQFALIWYLTETSNSASTLTMATLIAMLPQIILSPFSGAIIDRWNRRKVMMIADSFIAVITLGLGLLFLFDVLQIWHIFVVMFLRSIGSSFHFPAMMANTTMMVPKERLSKIQGLNQILQGAFQLGAPPLGAFLMQILPLEGIVFIDVLTAMVAVGTLSLIEIPQPAPKPATEGFSPLRQTISDTKQGFAYVWQWKGLFIFSMMMASVNLFFVPTWTLMPLYVKDFFSGNAVQYGLTQSAFNGGLIIGGLILSAWGGFKKKIHTTLSALVLIGVVTGLIAFLPGTGLIYLMLLVALQGLLIPLDNGPSMALRQEIVEPEMQGRYFAMAHSLATMMSPIGLAIAGPFVEATSMQLWFGIAGGITVIMGCFAWLTPMIRNLDQGNPNKITTTTEG